MRLPLRVMRDQTSIIQLVVGCVLMAGAALAFTSPKLGSLALICALGIISGAPPLLKILRKRTDAKQRRGPPRLDLLSHMSAEEVWALIPDGLAVIDTEGKVLNTNSQFEQLFQYGPGELPGKNLGLFLPLDLTEFLTSQRGNPLSRQQNLLGQRKDGTSVSLSLHLSPVRSSAGTPNILVSVRDMSERKLAEGELKARNALMSSGLDNSPTIFAVKDTSGHYLIVNRQFEELTQLARQDIFGKTDADIFPETLAKIAQTADRKLLETGTTYSLEQEVEIGQKKKCFFTTRYLLQRDGTDPPHICVIGTDITERKKAEHAVEELAAIVEFSQEAVVSLTLSGKILTWNPAATQLFGYSADEVIGKSCFILVPLGRGGELQENLKRLAQGERIETHETLRLTKDGTLIDVSLSSSPLRNGRGEVERVSWIMRDITSKKKAEAQVQQLSRVVQQTADMVMVTDAKGAIEYVNPAFESITGYSKAEVLGKNPSLLKSGLYEKSFYEKMWDIICSGKPFQKELINKRKDGSLYHIEKTITPLKDPNGKITHFVSTDKDLTERRRAEEEYLKILTRFQDLFNYSSDAIAYCDADGVFLDTNDAFSHLTGYEKSELVGHKKYQNISSEESLARGNRLLQKMQATGEPVSYEKDYLRKDGALVPVFLTAFPLKGHSEKKEKTFAIGVIARDVTEERIQEKILQDLAVDLERSNRELEQFAHAASHDLQEPLRTIVCYLQLIERTAKLSPESTQYVQFATKASRRLQGLIQDLLKYSSVGGRHAKTAEVDFEVLLTESLSYLEQSVQEAGAEIIHSPLPTLTSDGDQLLLVLQNLLSNAIKYRKPGHKPRIRLDAKKTGDQWRFSVTDDGIGMPPEQKDKLFVMFKRLHDGEQYAGNGIGLALCRKVLEGLGGQIWAEPNLEGGSTFYFTLPSGPEKETLSSVSLSSEGAAGNLGAS